MKSSVRFNEEAREAIRFERLSPESFTRAYKEFLKSLPKKSESRGLSILEEIERDDVELVSKLFDLAPVPESEVDRYAMHEGDAEIAAMARRALAQEYVSTKGMSAVVDDDAFREAIDSAGLTARVQNFGHYMRETLRLKKDELHTLFNERIDTSRIKRIVLPGAMGGSAIGASVVKMLLANQGCQTHLEILPHYPHSTRPLRSSDLAVIYAYSGNNEEQLLWMKPVLEAGAQVVGFAVGGRLEEMCKEENVPFVRIPGDEFNLAQPREHLPVVIILLLLLIGETGPARKDNAGTQTTFALETWLPRIEKTSHKLTEFAGSSYNVDLPFECSAAKQSALFLNWGTTDPDKVTNILATRDPVFWISALYEPIAKRLENQFGECVEHPAGAKIMPEDMHNEQEAYVQQWLETVWPLGEATGVKAPTHNVVFLRFADTLDARLATRADKLFNEMLVGAPRMTFEIRDYGEDCPMLGELEAILFCDLTRAFASIYRGVTPHYVHSMNYTKHYMATVEGTPGSTGTY